MNRSTLRKVFGDLWTRKGRTALVSISIFIGVLGVVTLVTAGDLLINILELDDQLFIVFEEADSLSAGLGQLCFGIARIAFSRRAHRLQGTLI